MRDYDEFLRSKRSEPAACGFEVADSDVNPILHPWQREIVRWAVRLGRAALFEDPGLGKTFQQAEYCRLVCVHTGGNALILSPLGVVAQTKKELAKLGIESTICRKQSDVRPGINITNYEMLKHFDPAEFVAVDLDEGGILKNFAGSTKKRLVQAFRETPFRLIATATPSPNDTMELGCHAEFLGVPGHKEMLARWFINDTMEAGNYRLKGHAEADFWRWVASWAVSISKPSDLGYPDDGYDLPPLEIIPHVVDVDLTDGAGEFLFRMPDLSATGMHKEMRRTAEARAAKVAEIVGSKPDAPWAVWCHTDYEADALKAAIPQGCEVRGSEKPENKARKLDAFAEGRERVVMTKPTIAGFGLNWQHASDTALIGVQYSFESFYQLICRLHRYGQKNPVRVHVVMAETEGAFLRTIQGKWEEHRTMKASMVAAMAGSGLRADGGRSLAPVTTAHASGDTWELRMGDNCREIAKIPDDSVGLTVSSPPFANLYIYSDIAADMGNSRDSSEYFDHLRYLIRELYRVTIPGRLCAFHCKDLPQYKGRDGSAGLDDFPGDLIDAFQAEGWKYHSRVTIWKDPVTEMQRTKNHGLLYKILCEDSSSSRQGMADYVVVFRKWVDGLDKFPSPVRGTGKERFDRYVGMDPPDPTELSNGLFPGEHEDSRIVVTPDTNGRWPKRNPFPEGSVQYRLWSIATWQRYASPVWFDIGQMDVLQYREARDEKDERHICPLQLDVIERAIHLWSNPGDLVLDPFNGIGSVGTVATKIGRRYVGLELKPSYFRQAVRNLEACQAERNRPTLFDASAA